MFISEKIKNLLTSTQGIYLLSLILACICTFCLGLFFPREVKVPSHPIQFIGEINPEVPYLKILGIKDSTLSLATEGTGIRIENENEILSAPEHSEFSIHLTSLKDATLPKSLNTLCPFVATKSGKYFYDSSSPKGQKITTGKRCFETEEEAVQKGLSKYSK